MNGTNNGMSCQTGCWALAAGAGAMIALLMAIGGTGILSAVFFGGVAFVILGFLFGYLFCSPLPKPGAASDPSARTARAAAPTATPAPAPAPAAPPAATDDGQVDKADGAAAPSASAKAPPPAPGAAMADTDSESGAAVKPTKDLPGQKELAERKGSWRYEAEGRDDGQSAGTKPATLDAPRPGGADDFKRIKGIGPKLEEMLHRLGFFHFDQIAAWSGEEAAWVDANLDGFNGRVTRDDWVAQAKALAAGEDQTADKSAGSGAT